MAFLATKIFGVFLASSLATVSPIILFGKGPPYEWVKGKTFIKKGNGEELLEQYKGKGKTRDEGGPVEDCKVAVLGKYFNDAFLARCDYEPKAYVLITKKPKQEEQLFQEIYGHVSEVMIKIDGDLGYPINS